MKGDRPIALVTGGARRVGRAIGLTLADAGCDIVLTYRNSRDEAQALAEVIRSRGGSVRTERVDLSDLAAVERLALALSDELPRLDVVVHNASIYEPTPLEGVDAKTLMTHYAVNAAAPLLLTRGLAPRLRQSAMSGGGSVVCMCDIHAMGLPRKGFSAYAMSKAALVELVRSLARELAPQVRVNGVAPGVVAFPESGYESDPEMQARYLARVPLGRSGTPEEAANAVKWLALEATYVTGEIVRIDGGRWLS